MFKRFGFFIILCAGAFMAIVASARPVSVHAQELSNADEDPAAFIKSDAYVTWLLKNTHLSEEQAAMVAKLDRELVEAHEAGLPNAEIERIISEGNWKFNHQEWTDAPNNSSAVIWSRININATCIKARAVFFYRSNGVLDSGFTVMPGMTESVQHFTCANNSTCWQSHTSMHSYALPYISNAIYINGTLKHLYTHTAGCVTS